jgi:UDP-N-acetylmuramyl pentapeptide phosphotransferase/UDP-N-acetylglucosamine-1-phosphate transferase
MSDTVPTPTGGPNLFPTFDSIEAVLWPAVALGVFVATAVIVDVMVILAARWRLVDLPNRRSAHALPTARGGGVAIVVTTALAALTLVFRWPPAAPSLLFGILLPSLVIAAVGLIDDVQPLRAGLRLAIHVVVAAWITAVFGPFTSITWPGLPPVSLGAAAWPLTMLWIVGMINAFNFMDGADGMAALGAVACGLTVAAIAWDTNEHLTMLLAAFTAAAAGGFLVFNWHPARVFMGDVGSGFLGTMLAILPLTFPTVTSRPTVLVPIAMGLWPFIADPLVSVIRRIAAGANPLEPHREFFFHHLVRSGASHAVTATVYGVLAAAGGLAGLAAITPAIPPVARIALPLVVLAASIVVATLIERRYYRASRTEARTGSRAPSPSPAPS